MNPLLNIENWKKSLGLLPIKLFSSSENEHILLNGNVGNFCIGFDSEKSEEDFYSYAWSSSTNNFISIKNDRLYLYNWLREKKEDYELTLINENVNKFYTYLLQKSYKSEYDIVPFIINIFKSIRNFTNEENESVQALNHLLLLLASYGEKSDFKDVDIKKWHIPDFTIKSGIENYLEEFNRGIEAKQLKPNIELILRHSSGQLFQEAQKEAVFTNGNRDKDLFGFYDTDYELKNKIYSSFHYTPSYLVRSIVEFSLSKLNLSEIVTLKILDPACGSSEFLLEALKQLKTIGYDGNVIIQGWDISESAINISNFLLGYEKREWNEKLTFELKVVDSLSNDWDNDYDLIIMNPPFSSWELMKTDEREKVAHIVTNKIRNKPNLASAFIAKSIRHLKEDGILGTVMPSSILLMNSYKELRKEINDTLSLLLVGKLGNFVFEYALTDVSIMIGKKPKSNIIPILLWTKNEKGLVTTAFRDLRKVNYKQLPYIKDKESHSIYIPDKYPEMENWKVNSFQEQELRKQLDSLIKIGKLKTVQDVFNVKQGIRTGNNKAFIITDEEYNRLPDTERRFFRPSIDNSSIINGIFKINNYIWYPYDLNGLLIKSEIELSNIVPTFYRTKFLLHKNNLISRARKDENSWWYLSEHRAWLRTKYPKVISTEFGKSGSFAFDKNGDFVIERGNGWIPKKTFNEEDYYFYLALFNSSFFEKLLSIYSRQLAGGKWYDLGKKHTSRIPIPELTEDLINTDCYKKILNFGISISRGDFSVIQLIDEYLETYIYTTK